MRALGVVGAEVVTETDSGFSAILICFQIYFFVFLCPPQPLDEQVVVIASFPIHTDLDSVLLQELGEGLTGELGTLVGVEDIRSALLERLLESINTATGTDVLLRATDAGGRPPHASEEWRAGLRELSS